MLKVKRALISVSDKTGLIDFVKGLQRFGIEVLSTGGTARLLQKAGLIVKDVSQYTGFPEMLDGRVKTLHPAIHGGLLAVRDNPEHIQQMKDQRMGFIDLVVVNLYPFENVVQKKNVALSEAIENIDIGGPAMIRSAAKNFKSVAVVSNPSKYKEILQELDTNSGILTDRTLICLATEAFTHTARYDGVIRDFFMKRFQSADFSLLPKDLNLHFSKIADLRYGENPHQAAAFYRQTDRLDGLARLKQLHGKELSYNNILDLDSAIKLVEVFKGPAVAIIKHNNPTGVAEDTTLSKAYQLAFSTDKLSAFGGIIGMNKKVDMKSADLIVRSGFMECVVAPGYDQGALKILKQKKNLRLIVCDFKKEPGDDHNFQKVRGGLLLQEEDRKEISLSDLKVVTKKKPTKSQIESLLFAWKVVKQVKSNAIVLAKSKHTIGIGCGQTSRVGSVVLALRQAGKSAQGSCLASDAFFPKIDNIQMAAKAGVKAIIQSGGSILDHDVIQQADRSHLAMVLTGVRHFRH
jgi:phosphoribosylaminoimidazolecarboxamide formyltransferase / IMP cyclohydrolase